MTFSNDEYTTDCIFKNEDCITITKVALENWRDYYESKSREAHVAGNEGTSTYYDGQAETLRDILAHFKEEGE